MKTQIALALVLLFVATASSHAACSETVKIKQNAGVSKTFVEHGIADCFSSKQNYVVTWVSHPHNSPSSWTIVFDNNVSPCQDPAQPSNPNAHKATFSSNAGDGTCTITPTSFPPSSLTCFDGDYDNQPICFKYLVTAIYNGATATNDPQVIVDSSMSQTARKKKAQK